MERRDLIAAGLERSGPYVGGLAVFSACFFRQDTVVSWFHWAGMNGKDAAGAVFNMMVTLTSFLFAVFVLAIAPGQGFLLQIFGTRTFRVFTRYVVEALVIGALAVILAMPFMSSVSGSGLWRSWWLVSCFLGCVAAAGLAFLRVVHIFMAWVGMASRGNIRKR